MADIKVWAMSLCIAAIAGAVIHMLVPNSSLEKMMRLVIAAFFLSCMLSPVLLRIPDLEVTVTQDSQDALNDTRERLGKAVDDQMAAAMHLKVESLLQNKGIAAENISLEYNTVEKTRISISQIDLFLESEYTVQKGEIEDYISGQTGVATRVTIGD